MRFGLVERFLVLHQHQAWAELLSSCWWNRIEAALPI